MNHQDILTLYEQELRIELEAPDMHKETSPLVVRRVRANPGGKGFISFSRLDAASADAEIQAQMAYFAQRQLPFEWDVFAYDQPADLAQRLLAYGFKPDLEPDDPGAVMFLDLHHAPAALLSPLTAPVRHLGRHQLDEVVRVEERVWGRDFDWLKDRLQRHMDIPGYLSVFVAHVDNDPASCGWIYYHPRSHFATLRGGSTVPEYRQRGLYMAILADRAQHAIQRGYRFLTVDATPTSRPILERHGFKLLTYARSYRWTGGQEAAA